MNDKIAIIGGGIAGLTAAYLLNPQYEITLFEKDHRLGGNAYTLTTRDGLSFDIAVAVFGKTGYPNFCRLLKTLRVPTCRLSGGGAGVRDLDTLKSAYLSTTPRGLLAQRLAMLRPGRLFPLLKNMKTLALGRRYYRAGQLDGLTMAEAFQRLPPLQGDLRLVHMFVLCLVSSMYYEEIMQAPASFFFGKMDTHRDFFVNPAFGMFQARHNTQSYVQALASRFADKIVLNARIRGVARSAQEVTLKMEDGSARRFGKVVFACNPDQTLRLLEQPTAEESRLLGAWKYKDAPIVVHTDRTLFPREFYNLFTFLYTDRNGKIHTSVNGHIRNLKSVPDDCRYLSSQHPNFPIAADRIEFSKIFRTPIFDRDAVATIPQLPSLNGTLNSYYCGSHFGYGLHEDCVVSARAVARKLGVRCD